METGNDGKCFQLVVVEENFKFAFDIGKFKNIVVASVNKQLSIFWSVRTCYFFEFMAITQKF